MITQELKDAVKAEADLLKQHATKEELARLDIKFLTPKNATCCIYGLTTGDCYSERACQLIGLCCTGKGYSETISRYSKPIFNANAKSILNKGERSLSASMTPIEFYIAQDGAQNANLIAYLKGETDTLEL